MIKSSKLIFCLIFCFSSSYFSAQFNKAFLKHLSESGLKTEHLTYLTESKLSADSLHYLKAKYYLQYADDSLFFEHFTAGKSLFLLDSDAVCLASKRYFVQSDLLREQWVSNIKENKNCSQIKTLLEMLAFSEKIEKENLEKMPEELRIDYKKLCRIDQKSPLLAGVLSALLPGSGKLYIGKPTTFLSALMINAIHFFQTTESGKKLGITHPFTLFNAGVFGVFYTANVYGSYKEVKQKKLELKREFIIHAANYYLSEPTSLY